MAILAHEMRVQQNEMGYELSYYQSDLPEAVAKAIEPWKKHNPI